MNKFIYESFSIENNTLTFHYSIPNYHFVHQIKFENFELNAKRYSLIFNLGLAEMFSYWKLTCAPVIEIQAGYLSPEQTKFWHKLLIRGMGQYFYENKIDFTRKNFIKIISSNTTPLPPPNLGGGARQGKSGIDKILIPIGGGKDSIVTYELLKKHFAVQPIIVYPTTPASLHMFPQSIVVKRILDPQILEPQFLKGHIPYSAILAFIFLLTGYKYIAVSNERSSEEGNVEYLGHTINHQYSKTLEFETDFNDYLKTLNTTPLPPPKLGGGARQGEGGITTHYFSFLRPLYELQITKLFSQMPRYFKEFRSCNKNQRLDSWCGYCPKCVSTALLLKPFLSKEQIINIIGQYPEESEMRQLTISKPFECILTKAEAQAILDNNLNPILSSWKDNPNMPQEFTKILKTAYENS